MHSLKVLNCDRGRGCKYTKNLDLRATIAVADPAI